jgi:hypothetical protein
MHVLFDGHVTPAPYPGHAPELSHVASKPWMHAVWPALHVLAQAHVAAPGLPVQDMGTMHGIVVETKVQPSASVLHDATV